MQTPSTVGRVTKWAGVSKSGIGIIGDSVITESAGNIGINVTNPSDKLAVGGGLTTTGPINTTSQYNIGGNRVLSADLARLNLFAGFTAGSSNTTGDRNSFFGGNAGRFNTTGNTNSFFGFSAGFSNTSGFSNSFFGLQAGSSNTTGQSNSFFGVVAGNLNTIGNNNTFFGSGAGYHTTSANGNVFFGSNAGFNNTTGGSNSFFGVSSGLSNTTELNNTFIGANSNGASGITNATALGANAVVTQNNSVVLGNNASVGVGTSAPQAKLHVVGTNAGRFDGNVTINGNLSVTGAANLTATNAIHATTADTATNFTGSLAGDVTGAQNATVVSFVGGRNAASVASAIDATNGATSANTANAIVKRDSAGNFSAGAINATQVTTTNVNLQNGKITGTAGSPLTFQGTSGNGGSTGGYLSLDPGGFYYPGGSVKLSAGATAPDYNSVNGAFSTPTAPMPAIILHRAISRFRFKATSLFALPVTAMLELEHLHHRQSCMSLTWADRLDSSTAT